jgi:hypothetical protein
MKIGFILTTYDRIDDLLAHLDILKYYDDEKEIIPIWMKQDLPKYFLDEMSKYKHAHYCDGIKFKIGPLLGLVSGLRKANELGIEYVVYRNGDDWLFNHDFVKENFNIIHQGKTVAAYNWLSHNTVTDFAMNELYLNVSKFMPSIDEAEEYFKKSSDKLLCESKIAKWIKCVLNRDYSSFYRLPDREKSPGIGYELESIPFIYEYMKVNLDKNWKDEYKSNQRYFNRKWQMIGSHKNYERIKYYNEIRREVSYASELEKEPNFARWISNMLNGLPWNIVKEKKITLLPNGKMPLVLDTKPKTSIPKMVPLLRRKK